METTILQGLYRGYDIGSYRENGKEHGTCYNIIGSLVETKPICMYHCGLG